MAQVLINAIQTLKAAAREHTIEEWDLEYVLEVNEQTLRYLMAEMRERYQLFDISDAEVDGICQRGGRTPYKPLGMPIEISDDSEIVITYGVGRYSMQIASAVDGDGSDI